SATGPRSSLCRRGRTRWRAARPPSRRAFGRCAPRALERLEERALERLHERRGVAELRAAALGRAQDELDVAALRHAHGERACVLLDDAALELERAHEGRGVALRADLEGALLRVHERTERARVEDLAAGDD